MQLVAQSDFNGENDATSCEKHSLNLTGLQRPVFFLCLLKKVRRITSAAYAG